MKIPIYFLLLFLSVNEIRSQTPTFLISFIEREIQIALTNKYFESVTRSTIQYSLYAAGLESIFFLPRTTPGYFAPILDASSALTGYASLKCTKKILNLNPSAIALCQKRVAVLTSAFAAVNSVLQPTTNLANHAGKVKVEIDALSVQNMINKYLIE